MNTHPPAIKRELLNYLRLEESEVVAESLISASILYVDSISNDNHQVHYWSYPTETGLAWVYLDANQSLGTTVDVPSSIFKATQTRAHHPIRKRNSQNPVTDRTVASTMVWIPTNKAPVCNFFPVWTELIAFEMVLEKFKAKATRQKVGHTADLDFCVKLTSGRYAVISSRENAMHAISIYLELGEDEKTAQDENCIGFAHICDIRELLTFFVRPFVLPTVVYPYEWRE